MNAERDWSAVIAGFGCHNLPSYLEIKVVAADFGKVEDFETSDRQVAEQRAAVVKKIKKGL